MPFRIKCTAWTLILFLLAAPLCAFAAEQEPPKTGTPLSAAELDRLTAPVALYPDSLLAQILMASTYPLDVVSAARWLKQNSGLKGKELENAAKDQPWDPSVQALTAFPQVLEMMNEKLDWVQDLGDAFLGQPKDVMDSVQRLRSKAQAAGNLKTTKEQKVTTSKNDASGSDVIVIQSAQPEVVYVPSYDPMVVYGPWPYPAYPPVAWYPPGYAAAGAFVSFGIGVAVGYAFWGDCDWNHGDIDVNVNNYRNFTKVNPPVNANGRWQHNPAQRGNVPYRGSAAGRYSLPAEGRGKASGLTRDQQRSAAREAFRGREGGAERPRRDNSLGRDGAGQRREIGRNEAEQRRELGRTDGAQRQRNENREIRNREPLNEGREFRNRDQGNSFFQGAGERGARQEIERGGRSRESMIRPHPGGVPFHPVRR